MLKKYSFSLALIKELFLEDVSRGLNNLEVRSSTACYLLFITYASLMLVLNFDLSLAPWICILTSDSINLNSFFQGTLILRVSIDPEICSRGMPRTCDSYSTSFGLTLEWLIDIP